MKKGYVLALALVGCLVSTEGIAKKRVESSDKVERIASDKPLCKDGACKKLTKRGKHKGSKSKCSCYCSVKCGPREIQKQDSPRIAKKDSKGQEVPEQCYCQQMDVDKYNENCNAPEAVE